jgi:hypothetical protein
LAAEAGKEKWLEAAEALKVVALRDKSECKDRGKLSLVVF